MDHIFNLDTMKMITCADCVFGCEEENSCTLLNKSLIGYHCSFKFYVEKESQLHEILAELQDQYCLSVFEENNDYGFVFGFSDYMRFIFFGPVTEQIRNKIIMMIREDIK